MRGADMPKFLISISDLRSKIGFELKKEDYEEAFMQAKCEIESIEGDIVKLDCKDINRADLWSCEGIARQLRAVYGKERGVPRYALGKQKGIINVDGSVKGIRPFISGGIAINVEVTNKMIEQIIQLQEKIATTFGSSRRDVAIGLYDFDKIKMPLCYKAVNPDSARFVPLGFVKEISLHEVLNEHPKGVEFGHLIKDFDRYPLLVDDEGNVASMPPIINSESTGKVTCETKNIFVEATGLNERRVDAALGIMLCALADNGGKIYPVQVNYPGRKVQTPDFRVQRRKVAVESIKRMLGLELKSEIKGLLLKARYDVVKMDKKFVYVDCPFYRIDILDETDIIEDIAVAYGYNRFIPEPPKIACEGRLSEFGRFCERLCNLMAGFGGQELLNFTLTSKGTLFEKMNLKPGNIAEIANPVSSSWSVLRNSVLPSLLDFSSKNTTQEYPQQVFELGEIVVPDAKSEVKTSTLKKLAWLLIAKEISYTNARQVLDKLFGIIGLEPKYAEFQHGSFIEGRVAQVKVGNAKVGVVGEIHPQALENFGLKMPAAGFELDVDMLWQLICS